ncbi:alpha/beta hydrolase family esterase [Streptomyces peucetius]|uniref:PHB depolymerase family esterase n=1 Tax=Streptomyces peucetius TaxID=1950 RepID=A0ABY6I377_STRPE|nr:PHB depolymerase family esterase [Streptomyces peucetius]UYQ60472.1 PHB depolymerase family esterase [Streptomyces peucetius]
MPPRQRRVRPYGPIRARAAVRRLRRTAGRLGAALAVAAGGLLLSPVPAAHAAVSLERVGDFGADPGNLDMYVYRSASLTPDPAVVVALHGCTQSAQVYADNSGLTTFADRHGFLLVLAGTTSANNINSCFNWFQATDNRRGQGEAASIRQMAAYAEAAYGADPARTFVTGLSAGGAMTSVMLATYPDVFEAGAVVAGLPYDCTRDTGPFVCMNPGTDRTPQVWAQRVRDAYPAYTGPWPRVAVWHGDDDSTVSPVNARELRDQWTAVHALGQAPDRTSVIGPNGTRREQYLDASGRVAVEVDRVPSTGHGTPVDPGSGPEQCGRTGTAHFIDSICSSLWITDFFGLTGGVSPDPDPGPGPGDPEPPACWTASNYAHVRAGRATTTGGHVCAKGSGQHMGLYNTFVTHTLKESPAGHYTLADGGCP